MVMTLDCYVPGQEKHFHFDMLDSDREKSDSSVTAFYIYSLYYPCAVLQCCRLQAAHSSDVCGLVSICSIVRVSSVCQHPAALQSAVRVTGTHCSTAALYTPPSTFWHIFAWIWHGTRHHPARSIAPRGADGCPATIFSCSAAVLQVQCCGEHSNSACF